jgi:hypothetical protein
MSFAAAVEAYVLAVADARYIVLFVAALVVLFGDMSSTADVAFN